MLATMRNRRIYGAPDSCVYHCVTRTVNGEKLLGPREQSVLRKMLHQVVAFSGVELMTYAIMDNHLHVLVRVSDLARAITDYELIKRFKILYPKPTNHQLFSPDEFAERLKRGDADAAKVRRQLLARMGDISEFMRTLKQRFSIWFNKSHNRFGPLWSDRFKSAIIENDPSVVITVAAYIDLNPVRAGIVEDPKDYPFCGYNEALAGHESLQLGLLAILQTDQLEHALADYRMILFGKGTQPKQDGNGHTLNSEQSRAVNQSLGEISTEELLRHRLRFISNGTVIGSSEFVTAFIGKWSKRIGDVLQRMPKPIGSAHLPSMTTFRRVSEPK